MKKLILGFGVFALSFAFLMPQASIAEELPTACYEAYYPTKYCDTQGFDNCVNQICPPPPTCSQDDDCNSEV
ncbi:MAG: hypothetical protein ABJH64_07135 [Algoriphagus sp.]|uniref:hypothetical protein n=1 Tax=Algoriphagus sp. TaxID=1872435 RepID=UPI003296AED2